MRPVIYASVATLLGLLALAGLGEAAAFREVAQERERRLARDRLEAWVEHWEGAVADRVGLWLVELSGDRARERAHLLRQQIPWFDGYYRWELGAVAFPDAAIEEHLRELRAEPCLADATAKAGRDQEADAAWRYARCAALREVSPAARLLAASEAAELYLNAEAPALAREVVAPLASMPLQTAVARGLAPRRLVFLRAQEARALDQLGRTDLAERITLGTAQELLALEAPDLEVLLPLYAYPLAHDLRRYGGPSLGGEEDEALARAERRVALWTELRDRRETLPGDVAEGPRILVDPYSEPPWLLSYVHRAEEGYAGIALDQPQLLQAFIARAPEALRPHLSVRDPTGKWLVGESAPLETEVAFTRVLPHLRAGLTHGAVAVGEPSMRTLAVQLLPVGIGLVMGTVALFALASNDRRQQRLLGQQREFMTRVTHELKTPLAGIRLMAETLELGAFRDAGQRVRFAQQIVKEAERLGARLDEVIQAAARPLEEERTETDLGALARDLAETWRPRFEQQRGSLELELPESALAAHVFPIQLRDAISNLLDNALKYRSPERPVACKLRVRAQGKWAAFEVTDNGLGVPPEKRKEIFGRFTRVEGPGRGHAGGHGLGLAFVADAARAHGGKVDCREGPGGGSVFTLRIRR